MGKDERWGSPTLLACLAVSRYDRPPSLGAHVTLETPICYPPKGTDELLAEVKELAAGGAYGSIMGRNAFQRPRTEAIKLLQDVMQIFRAA